MSLQLYLTYVAACIALAILPGPIVALVIANGLRHGTRAALVNVAGAQAGSAIVITIVGIGLTSLIAAAGAWFEWIRLAGALYLVWLGIKMIRKPDLLPENGSAYAPPRGGFFLQGFLVLLSNPKVLVFFGAFIPQFIDLKRDHAPQIVLLGATFMVIAALSDGAYALLAGRARHFLAAERARALSQVSGLFMIGGGVWLALARRA